MDWVIEKWKKKKKILHTFCIIANKVKICVKNASKIDQNRIE